MKARKVALLFLFLAFGAVVETAYVVRNRLDLGPAGCRVLRGRFTGPSFAFDAESRHALTPAAPVQVDNAFGAVRVIAGAPGEVRITLRKVVFLPHETEARAFAERVQLRALPAGSGLRVTTNRDELERGDRGVGFETHLELAVPPATRVEVRNEHGRVEIADVARADVVSSYEPARVERVAGPVRLETRHGDVVVAGVEGDLELKVRHGHVEARDLKGAARLEVAHGDLAVARAAAVEVALQHGELSVDAVAGLKVRAQHAPVQGQNVGGAADVETTYNSVRLSGVAGDARVKAAHATVQVSGIEGALDVETSYDDVTLDGIGGEAVVKVAHGGVRARGLAQGARITGSGSRIEVDGFRGPLEVDAQRAAVHLVPEGPLSQRVSVRTTHGEIRLVVPPDSRFALDASTTRGEVQVDVPGLAVQHSSRSQVTATLGGGGAAVRLVSEPGDVIVEARAVSAAREP